MLSKMKIKRLMKGYSLATLEKHTGIPIWTLSKVENGLVPKPDEVKKLCRVLETHPQALFPVFEPEQWQEYLTVN